MLCRGQLYAAYDKPPSFDGENVDDFMQRTKCDQCDQISRNLSTLAIFR